MKPVLFLLCLLVCLLAAPLPAEAGLWARCQDWFEGLPTHPDQKLWEETFAPDGKFPYLPGGKEELILEGVHQLPAGIQQNLLRGGAIPALGHLSLLDQAKALGPELPEKFAAFEARRTEASAPAFFAAVEQAQESHRWILGAGAAELPLFTEGRGTFVQLGAQRVRVTPAKGGLVFSVPRSRVAHAFDNPVSLEHVRELLQAGKKPPKVYEGVLGLDGKFYLSDGNHRFELDPRDFIPVRLSAPRTTGLRTTLDLLGQPQPSAKALHDYFSGKISWRNLVPERLQQTFLFEPKP